VLEAAKAVIERQPVPPEDGNSQCAAASAAAGCAKTG